MADPTLDPRRRAEAGHALITALIATALLLPLGAFAVMQARLDFLVSHHTRAASETFAVAESGLDHALADLAREPRFDRLLAGPDRRAGTPDDGEFPFTRPPPAFFPAAPYRYDVRVAALSADRVEIVARGYGPLATVRAVSAAVARTPLPYLPAALACGGADVDLLLGSGWRLEGAAGSGGDPDVPALAVASDPTAERLAARLGADGGAQLRGPGGAPSLGVAAIPEVEPLLAAARQRLEARPLGAEASGDLGDGLFVSRAGVRLRDVTGRGILLVDGALDIVGTLAFEGLIATTGALSVDAGAAVAITGAILQGSHGGPLLLRGDGRVVYQTRVAERLADAFPGLLPTRARITAWRELPDAEG